jgi:hypothetical protein
MSAAPTLTWEQYQQLPPELRRRPLTPAEYAALSQSQLEQAGLAEPNDGAPANFGGPVFPNPNHVQPQLDTDSAVPVTALPHGVSFQKENYQGGTNPDLSNPATADILPEAGRTISADFSPGAKSNSSQSNSMSTVPIISPAGDVGDVPFTQMKAALAAGGKMGVSVKAPDGTIGVVPADRYQDAAKAGATILPYKEQETQHPGFWATAADQLGGLLHPSGFSPYPGMDQEAKSAAATQSAQQDQSRKAAGYSLPYRAAVPVAQAAGVNVPAMEQSAKEGDVAGVAAGAVVPIATLGAAEAIHQTGVGAKVTTRALDAAGDAIDAARQKITNVTPKQAAQVVGGAGGGIAGHGPLSAPGAYYGAKTAGGITEGVLGKERANAPIFGPKPITPELDATSENKPFAGAPKPKTEVLDATGENKPFAGGMDEAPTAQPVSAPPTPPANPQPVAQQAAPAPRTVVVDPETGRPEFSDVIAAKAKSAAPDATLDALAKTNTPAAEDLLAKLSQIAKKIQSEEEAEPGAADEDLIQKMQDSIAIVNARKALQKSMAVR